MLVISRYHNITIVSTSNLNRGRLAEIVLREELKKREIEGVVVCSRGLAVLFPEPMNQKAAMVLSNNDIQVNEEQVAIQLQQEDIDKSDLILTLKMGQKEKVLEEYENVPDIFTIKELAQEPGTILDPYGKDMIDYEYCFRELERLVEKIVNNIEEPLQNS